MYESQMAQRRIQENRNQDIQQRLTRDSTLKANFESERRVDYMRHARMDDQRTAEWETMQAFERVRDIGLLCLTKSG